MKAKKKSHSLTKHMMRYWYLYLFVALALLVAVALNAMSPKIIGMIIDDVIIGGRHELLVKLLVALVGINVLHAVFNWLKEFTSDCIGVKTGGLLRRDLYTHIQKLGVSFFSKNNTGELMARVKDDVDKVWFIMGFAGMLIFEAVIHTVVTLFCMFDINPLLTLIPIIIMIGVAVVALLMEKRLDDQFGQLSEANAQLNDVAQENLAGVRTVKAFAREGYEIERFNDRNQKYYEASMRIARTIVRFQPFISVSTKIMLVAVIVVGGVIVIKTPDNMSLGDLGAFVEYANGIIWPMEVLGWLSNEFASAFASNKKIGKVFAAEPEIVSPENPAELSSVRGEVEFRNVSFSIDETHVLEDVSFRLEQGKTLGIMGMTGSGKSTVVNLLERFYDASEGEVYVDGVDVRNLSLETLRSNVAVVMQDVFLFSDTISENIKLGHRHEFDNRRMIDASRAAGASEFIDRLGDGYDTVIGERGVGLSGGQKQRISIARALAKNAPILVLDDATSALDMETEYAIQQSLGHLDGTSKIIIAHRISAVKDADEIIILDNGKIVERGTHAQLMQLRGLYFATYVAQYNTEVDMVTASEDAADEADDMEGRN